VPAVVAVRTPLDEFLDDCSLRPFVRRIVIALEQLGRSAIATPPVAFVNHALLSCSRMAPAT